MLFLHNDVRLICAITNVKFSYRLRNSSQSICFIIIKRKVKVVAQTFLRKYHDTFRVSLKCIQPNKQEKLDVSLKHILSYYAYVISET